MYFIDRNGVTNLENGVIVEPGTIEWTNYKQWCSQGNTPEFGEVHVDEEVIKVCIDE